MATLTMRVSSRTEPAKLGSAITHHLRENPSLQITVFTIGSTAEEITFSALEIANAFSQRDGFRVSHEVEEHQFGVDDRTPGAKPGSVRDVVGKQFDLSREELPDE